MFKIIWLFLLYSFLGWCLDAVFVSLRKKKFVNMGFLNGPFCPIYAINIILILIFTKELVNRWFFLFLGSAIIASGTTLFLGKLLNRIFGKRLWDYSDRKFNLDGYICPEYFVYWGILGVLTVKFVNPLSLKLFNAIPGLLRNIAMLVLLGLLVIDYISTVTVALKLKRNHRLDEVAAGLYNVKNKLGNAISHRIQRRLLRAYPHTDKEEKKKEADKVFAQGCSFYKLVMLFIIGAFLGDVTETVFCLLTTGVLMSRSSVVYGPFSIVWGLGIAMFTWLLYRLKDKDDRYLFFYGTVLGGAYEYICSVFTELVFGTVFWDYSKIPFNLGGRINLLYCLFWGIAAIIWMKILYPRVSALIEKIPVKPGKIICRVLIVFMIFDILMSAAAMLRYTDRATGKEAGSRVEEWLDERFTDERMERIYPNAIIK